MMNIKSIEPAKDRDTKAFSTFCTVMYKSHLKKKKKRAARTTITGQ